MLACTFLSLRTCIFSLIKEKNNPAQKGHEIACLEREKQRRKKKNMGISSTQSISHLQEPQSEPNQSFSTSYIRNMKMVIIYIGVCTYETN